MAPLRYQLVHNGVILGTVWLDSLVRPRVTARLAPLPAFKRVRPLLDAAESGASARDPIGALTATEQAEEDLALARIGPQFALTDERGEELSARSVRVLVGPPPSVRVHW